MKANELRLGNYVYDNLGGVLKIKGISLDSTLSHIKPIPLTEEWLVKFGFISNPYEDRYEKGLIHVECDKTKGATYLWINNMPHIKHIHQLQNLYFAITGEELTTGGQNE